jgi:hypothetical protein
MVGRSKSGYGFPPALNFKDVHHPHWGGRRVEPGFCLPRGPAARFFLQHSGGGEGFTNHAKEANFGYAGPARCRR